MTERITAEASLSPPGLPGLDPTWSRLVTVPSLDGVDRTFHVLDNGAANPDVTLLCVHGNPSWSYLWRDLLAMAPAGVRVVALDHLDMGFSERTGTVRRLAQRVSDLGALTEAMGIDGPVITAAHDWGGPISLGWALEHQDQLRGVVLMNTAVHQPEGARAPRLIRAVRARAFLDPVAVSTPGFVRGSLALSRPPIPPEIRAAFLAPYATKARRPAIADFVRDIPLEPDHPSSVALDGIADGLQTLGDVPVLMLWGPSDPVFSDLYLHDLEARLPHAKVHRFIGASHFVSEDADVVNPILDWMASLDEAPVSHPESQAEGSAWSEIEAHNEDDAVAVIEMGDEGVRRSRTWRELAADVRALASGLVAHGVQAGDRIALLVPPGVDLTTILYACWRMGAVVVVVDAGLGARGMGTALRSADPDYLVSISKGLLAARTMGWPGARISVDDLNATQSRALNVVTTIPDLVRAGVSAPLPETPTDNDVAAVAFTSGATGPAKGVVYRHGQLKAQRDALIDQYRISADDRLVAAFAPFSLFGPAMGIPSVVPDMDVTSPSTLDASALAAAADAVEATLVFASPSAIRNVLATAGSLTVDQRTSFETVRLLLSAGAPVPAELLRAATELMPNAEPHTPYGMTETLPVADISLAEIDEAGVGRGVCVGVPLASVSVAISPLDAAGKATMPLTTEVEVVGEVCVRAAHMKDSYDRLWVTQHASASPAGWHRSGDVGHFDEAGRLWVEGRLVHTISTADGMLTPLWLEQRFRSVEGISAAAAVGVGPKGDERLVAIVVPTAPIKKARLAATDLATRVRSVVDIDVVAVLEVPNLPVDKRHNAKVDRVRLRRWANKVLAGGRIGKP
ncbi:MAG: alpha/beta fold hydrolase [Acidimicrobiia bacterium]